MLLPYDVTDIKSLITLVIYTGRCYCHLISGRCCPLDSSVADVISHGKGETIETKSNH